MVNGLVLPLPRRFESVSQESQFSLNMKLNDSNSQPSSPQGSPTHHSSATFRHDKGIVGGLVMASMIFILGCVILGLSMRARHMINVNESNEHSDQDVEDIDIMSPLSPSRVVREEQDTNDSTVSPWSFLLMSGCLVMIRLQATAGESEMTWVNGSPSFS